MPSRSCPVPVRPLSVLRRWHPQREDSPPTCWTNRSWLCSATADQGETGEAERLLELDGVRILLTHGHGYSVKASLLPLRRRALELGVQLVLYGHTRLAALANEDSILFCNPGSWTAPSAPRSNCWIAAWRMSASFVWIRPPPPCKRKKAPGEFMGLQCFVDWFSVFRGIIPPWGLPAPPDRGRPSCSRWPSPPPWLPWWGKAPPPCGGGSGQLPPQRSAPAPRTA